MLHEEGRSVVPNIYYGGMKIEVASLCNTILLYIVSYSQQPNPRGIPP